MKGNVNMNIQKIDELRQNLAIYIDTYFVDNLSDTELVNFSLKTERALESEMHAK